jgi:hypothetical protein
MQSYFRPNFVDILSGTRTINEKKATLEERNVVCMLRQWQKSHEVALGLGKIL